jgi:alkylation response protein AidB-like acyl-CoA dehydrogenase
MRTELGFDPEAWRQFAQLGWLALPFSEEQGGIGGDILDVMVVCEALGGGLVREPFLSTVVTCGGLLRHGGSPAQQTRHIPGIIDGTRHWAFAFAETGGSYRLENIRCSARAAAQGYRLNGEKRTVLNGHCADHFIVTARLGEGLSLFIVDRERPGVELRAFSAVDGSRGAHVSFNDVSLQAEALLGSPDDGLALLQAVLDEAIVAIGAEALGSLQAMLDATVEYTGTRVQFGQPIGKFQALQHRMADMYLKVEELRSLLYNAAIALGEGSDEAPLACAALKVKLADAGRAVSHEAVQLHGGIGMTDELALGHHLKRVLLLSKLYGDGDFYLRRYQELGARSESSALSVVG